MSSIMLSPGVLVRELDYSEYIAEASTCIVGIVGGARKGPLRPTLITSREQLIKTFGKPTLQDYGIYSALAVLENADKIYYQRVIHNGVKASDGTDGDLLHFEALEVGPDYNGITVTTAGTETDFTVTITKGSETIEFTNCAVDAVSENYVVNKVNGNNAYVNVVINELLNATFTAKTYALANGTNGCNVATTSNEDNVPVKFESKTPDSTINGAKVIITSKYLDNTFDVQLVQGTEVLELHKSLSVDPASDRFIENFINRYSNYMTCTFDETTEKDITATEYTFSGGTDGIIGITASEIIGTSNDGIQGFYNPEEVDIDVLIVPGWSDASVVNAAIQLASSRQDCLYLIDPPRGLKPQQVIDWSNGTGSYSGFHKAFDSSYAALYWSWLQITDPYSGQDIWLPPSGYVASQIAYSDKVAEPWFAPAGLNRGKLNTPIAIEYNPNKGERDMLYGNKNIVNPIVNYKGQGLTIWGQRTTQRKPSALDRVNVRRLTNYLKKVIAASTEYYVFEPNDEYCWQKWVDMVEPKLAAIKAKRGVYDYRVIMDSTTVTTDDINNNRMPGKLMYKPTKTAEFIPLDFMIMPTGASFEED